MPKNNNQKAQSVASRLAQLPMVQSACTKLSVLYTDTKSSHPHLRSVVEGLESSVTAVVSSVTVKLEPQISIANTIACKSIDWLETTFPVVQAPTEQVVATAKNKMHEIQDVVRLAANGTVDCVQQTITWLLCRIQQDQPLVERAFCVASMGLESVLTVSEALMDRMLPPSEKDKEAAQVLVGFELATSSSSPVRLVSLGAKMYKRIYLMVVENLSSSSGLVQTSWQSLAWSMQELPQYMQHQLVSMLFFIFHIYSLNCSPTQHHQPNTDRSSLNASKKSTHKIMLQVHPEATPSACRMRRSNKVTAFDTGCDKGCVYRRFV